MKLSILFLLIFPLTVGATHQDVLDVAWTIYQEGKGETYHGKCAIATVIYNRAMEQRITYQQVVKQPKQFSCWNSNRIVKVYDDTYFDQCLYLSEKLHAGTFDPLNDWNHYFNPNICSPFWFKSMTNIHIIDQHLFGTI